MRITFAFIIFIIPALVEHHPQAQLIVWNVGQGQWVTLSEWNYCLHIDTGGETWPKEAVNEECKRKQNRYFLTHADWDHVSFIPRALRNFKSSCRLNLHTPSFKKAFMTKLFTDLPLCEPSEDLESIEVKASTLNKAGRKPLRLNANDLSTVVILRSAILIPGDSTARAERYWSTLLDAKPIRHLVLGHHGSKTSTSTELLRALPKLLQTSVSAREKKYGHPHPQVLSRLKHRGLMPLKTEDWGHLRFGL